MVRRAEISLTIFVAGVAGCAMSGDVESDPRTAESVQGVALPLLDRAAIRAPFAAACSGQPDSTPLPVDPRSLVVPGVNRPGAAVQFNAYWVDLHAPAPPYRLTLPALCTTACGPCPLPLRLCPSPSSPASPAPARPAFAST